ncbi:MAG TPA: trypsin-like peptidase domain-containing protein [Thermoplasmata archaeon]|nr:trypsin-like peptidase domain-containing protein [Thermoplasmata archaeon]
MSLAGLESELVEAVERVRPSVARIRRSVRISGRGERVPAEAAGSGLVVDPRGYLVTNDHVVRGSRDIRATFDDGRELSAEVVGEDPATDLAVLRVGVRDLPAARLADSERLRVGQFALALGNALGLPGGPSLSVGVISALGRPLPGADHVLEGLIQTDAAINPGNSGGPLAALDGSVIGVNTAIVPYAQGVGFAIPSNAVRTVVDEIVRSGRVARPWLGISGLGVDPSIARRFGLRASRGVLLAEVHRPGPAGAAGLRPGDVLLRLGPNELAGLRDLVGTLGRLPLGGAVDFEYLRDGSRRRGVLRIEETPPGLPAE